MAVESMVVPTAAEMAVDEAPPPLVVTRAPKGREEEFVRKRAAEELLLLEYETSGQKLEEFRAAKQMKKGTIDGIFARVRKRRAEVADRC